VHVAISGEAALERLAEGIEPTLILILADLPNHTRLCARARQSTPFNRSHRTRRWRKTDSNCRSPP